MTPGNGERLHSDGSRHLPQEGGDQRRSDAPPMDAVQDDTRPSGDGYGAAFQPRPIPSLDELVRSALDLNVQFPSYPPPQLYGRPQGEPQVVSYPSASPRPNQPGTPALGHIRQLAVFHGGDSIQSLEPPDASVHIADHQAPPFAQEPEVQPHTGRASQDAVETAAPAVEVPEAQVVDEQDPLIADEPEAPVVEKPDLLVTEEADSAFAHTPLAADFEGQVAEAVPGQLTAHLSHWDRVESEPSPPEQEDFEVGGAVPDFSEIRDRVAIMLVFYELIRPERLAKAWAYWESLDRKPADTFWRYLATLNGVDQDRIYEIAAEAYAFPTAVINRNEALAFLRDRCGVFTEEAWKRLRGLCLIPVAQESEAGSSRVRWIFATHDPSRPTVVRAIRELGLDAYELRFAPRTAIDPLLAHTRLLRNSYLDQVVREEHVEQLPTAIEPTKTYVDEAAVTAQIAQSSLVNLFEAMLIEAVRWGASDIHIFPAGERRTEIHFRVDGDLVCWRDQDRLPAEAFLAVIKDNVTNVDRFERDAAQDGFMQRTVDDATIRYRVSVVPLSSSNVTMRAESVVVRVLDDRRSVGSLARIITRPEDRDRFDWAMQQPQGMVILTGPTGSGKSTTLVAALQHVASPRLNTITIEDPVEYVIPGVRQLRINNRFGVSEALRYILRHDPDIVMVGEMRDYETADLAIKLANTGHLTFSTLHANDAASVVSRLFKMGVEPFLIAHAINLVVAQRLIRTLCPVCKQVDTHNDALLLRRLGFDDQEIQELSLYGRGSDPDCERCKGTGFHGRTAVVETLVFTESIRRIIAESKHSVDEIQLRKQALEEGMLPLRDAAADMLRKGLTAPRELLRAVTTEYRAAGAR